MSNRIINLVAFAALAILWTGFGGALVLNQQFLDATWQTFSGWPGIVQALVALLTLPVVVGLWIWETSWPAMLRLVLVAGLAFATLYTFWPKKTTTSSDRTLQNA